MRMCRRLRVSPSGYYAWRRRPPSRRQREDTELLGRIEGMQEASGRVYGTPRVWAELRAAGVRCSRKLLSAADAGGGDGGGVPPASPQVEHGAGRKGGAGAGPSTAAVSSPGADSGVGGGPGAGAHAGGGLYPGVVLDV